MQTLGIVGFGSFGRFMADHLARFFEVVVCDRRDLESEARQRGVRWGPLELVAASRIVAFAVPVQDLEAALGAAREHLRPPTLVVDVGSVKVKPLELMDRLLDPRLEILGTHPMFGPQSGRHGIAGLKIVLCPRRCRHLRAVRAFLEGRLLLQVLEMAPQRHDSEMAYIQGLTHWMAKALRELKVPDSELATPAYRHLMRIEEILREDSLELFLTIERENPFVEAARSELMAKLVEIEEMIGASSRSSRLPPSQPGD